MVNLIQQTTATIFGEQAVENIAKPSMGSEDFAFFASEVPGAMFRLGCVSEKAGGAGLHTSHFDIDEEAIKVGAHVMAHAAIVWMERHAKSGNGSAAQVT